MSAANFFSHPSFPSSIQDRIDTLEFLNASRGLVWLIEQFGFGFEPVKADLLGNIEKLHKKYYENTIEYNCIKRMILLEYQQGENFATESLLWLRRGLSFMGKFLAIFIENEKSGQKQEDLKTVLKEAYKMTLKIHHGWGTRVLFDLLCSRCPTRSKFLEIIGCEEVKNEELLISLLDSYLANLILNLEVLIAFCERHDIKPYH